MTVLRQPTDIAVLTPPATNLTHQLSRKDISKRNKFELGERAMLSRAFQPTYPITNSLSICAQAKRLKTKR